MQWIYMQLSQKLPLFHLPIWLLFFVNFSTALIKRSMNVETADANTMLSAAE